MARKPVEAARQKSKRGEVSAGARAPRKTARKAAAPSVAPAPVKTDDWRQQADGLRQQLAAAEARLAKLEAQRRELLQRVESALASIYKLMEE